MEKLEHPLWIVDAANRIFGPAVNALLGLFGMRAADPANPIPNYLVIAYLVVARARSPWPSSCGRG